MPFVQRALRAGICCMLAATVSARAAPPGWVAVDAATLAQLRGGFVGAGGLALSLGIERVVAINGEVVARTSMHIADLGNMTAEQAQQTGAALSAVKLIQNGGDNIYLADLADSTLGGTVIQNSLSDQRIESRTIINASVNSMGLLKALNFHRNVSDAIARAAGPP